MTTNQVRMIVVRLISFFFLIFLLGNLIALQAKQLTPSVVFSLRKVESISGGLTVLSRHTEVTETQVRNVSNHILVYRSAGPGIRVNRMENGGSCYL